MVWTRDDGGGGGGGGADGGGGGGRDDTDYDYSNRFFFQATSNERYFLNCPSFYKLVYILTTVPSTRQTLQCYCKMYPALFGRFQAVVCL